MNLLQLSIQKSVLVMSSVLLMLPPSAQCKSIDYTKAAKTRATNLKAYNLLLQSKAERYCKDFQQSPLEWEQNPQKHRKILLDSLERIANSSTISESLQDKAKAAILELNSIERLRKGHNGSLVPWLDAKKLLVEELSKSTLEHYQSKLWYIISKPLFFYDACIEIELAKDFYTDKKRGKSKIKGVVKRKIFYRPVALNGRTDVIDKLPRLEPGDEFVFEVDKYHTDVPALEKFAGSRCVLGFSVWKKEDGVYPVSKVQFPLGMPPYENEDIERLEEKLNDSLSFKLEVRKMVEAYIHREWPKELVEMYVRPETRYYPLGQRLVPLGECYLAGQLYPDAEEKLGKVKWDGSLDRFGRPVKFELEVTRGERNIWVLDMFSPTVSELFAATQKSDKMTKQEMKRRVLDSIMHSGYFLYRLIHFEPSKIPDDYLGMKPGELKLRQDSTGKVIGFSSVLKNGKTLKADVSNTLKISNVTVDDKPNKYWPSIFVEIVENIEKMYKDPLLQLRI